MMAAKGADSMVSGAMIMFLSAALFGYFGFFFGLTSLSTSGEWVFMYALLVWALRGGAIGFLASGIMATVHPIAGNLLYCVVGALTAIALAGVGILDVLDTQRAAALPPLLAFLFAAWNGYGSWVGLREVMAARRAVSDGASDTIAGR